MSVQNDIIFNLTPKCFVAIGKTLIDCMSVSITINNKEEISTCDFTIPIEQIKSDLFAQEETFGKYWPVDIYAGYVHSWEDVTTLENVQKSTNFCKRFSGYIYQPEWEFGTTNTFKASCMDWLGILREIKYVGKAEGGTTEIHQMIKEIQKYISGISIEIEEFKGAVNLGTFDTKEKKWVYSASGKSLYDILLEISHKLGYTITSVDRKILLHKSVKTPKVWTFSYGGEHAPEKGQFFDKLTFRYGEKGRNEKTNVIIMAYGTHKSKKGNGKGIVVQYPENAERTALTKIHKITIPGGTDESTVKAAAENEYLKYSKAVVTGNITVPWANQFLLVNDALQISNENRPELFFLKKFNFRINSISESYSISGYSQTIEFESDPSLVGSVSTKIPVKAK